MNLVLLAIGMAALAQDGLISIPKDAELGRVEARKPARGPFLEIPGHDSVDAPASGTVEDYVNWAKAKVLADKQTKMAQRALQSDMKPSANISCLEHHSAFGFSQVSESQFKMNCWAGTNKRITHVIDYEFALSFLPQNCALEQNIRNFFSATGKQNANAAGEWLRNYRSCTIVATPLPPRSPFYNSYVGVDPSHIQDAVSKKPELEAYINQSRATKNPATNPGGDTSVFRNPLRDIGVQRAN